MISARLSSKGQVTLPKEIRDYLGIEPRARVYSVIEDGVVRILPAEKGIEALKGSVRVSGEQDFKAARHRAMEEVARERSSRTAGD